MNISEYWEEYDKKLKKEEEQAGPTFREFLNSVKSEGAGLESTGGEELEGASMENANETDENDVAAAVAILRDSGRDTEVRIIALRGIGYEIGNDSELITLLFELLANREEPVDLRIAILGVLQQLNFSSALFRSRMPEYTAILRSIVQRERSDLQVMAMEVLSRFKDRDLQEHLIAGLKGEEEQMVPAEKAIQLLGYDIHAGIFGLLQDIVNDPPNAAAKNEAMRILAADAGSKELFRKALLDKDEDMYVRRTSAAALMSLAPGEFEEVAKEIVRDDDDYDEIRATSLTGLEISQAGTGGSGLESFEPADNRLNEKVEQLIGRASGDLKKAADRFLATIKKK